LRSAAAECSIGIEFLARTLPIIMASLSEQFFDSHSGNKTPFFVFLKLNYYKFIIFFAKNATNNVFLFAF